MKTSFPNVCALLVSSLVLLARSSTAEDSPSQAPSSGPTVSLPDTFPREVLILDKGRFSCNETLGEFECGTLTTDLNDIDEAIQYDKYQVHLTENVEYVIEVERIDCFLDPQIQVYYQNVLKVNDIGTNGTETCIPGNPNPNGEDPRVVYTPLETGLYVLLIRGSLLGQCPSDQDFDYKMTFNPAPDGDAAGCKGDPHFSTWKGEHYDYHGKCDLELVSDPLFANGKGLDVHIRTEILRQWSYIKHGAIRIGNDILEVEGGADENHYWFNKVYQGELTTLGGFPVKYKKANSKQHMYTIDLGNQEEIVISTFKDFVRIDFKEPKKSLYGNTVGLLADFNTGKKLGRDGSTIIEDYNDFGQEWQVLADGPKLFHEVSGRQFPGQKCVLPSELHAEEQRRRGQEKRVGGGTPNTITDTIAELACAKVSVAERDACVSDVLITGDVSMAGAY